MEVVGAPASVQVNITHLTRDSQMEPCHRPLFDYRLKVSEDKDILRRITTNCDCDISISMMADFGCVNLSPVKTKKGLAAWLLDMYVHLLHKQLMA